MSLMTLVELLFVVPTLDLAAQTALAWRRDQHLEHMVIVVRQSEAPLRRA
ncbi:hypothetical protein [Streptomyces sp. CL12-4]|nr:hypothetical protein [Streptomyces sp. CL12-4]MCG8970437.1 hypothetical protein [Streptomyces sp. CL12-4]